jgi:hypothetical protein
MAIRDRYKTTQGPWPAKYVSDPVRAAAAVTTSDSVDLPNGVACALYIGVTGDVVVTLADMDDGTSVTFKAHPVGYMLTQVKRVWATSTTATNILALY